MGTSQHVLGDTWKLDAAVQGWEEVVFASEGTYNSSCHRQTINLHHPGARSGHAMSSTGSVALMCGGVGADGVVVGSSVIDCWWFSASPIPKWSRINTSSSSGPSPRQHFAMQYDSNGGHVILHGGLDRDQNLTSDCWYRIGLRVAPVVHAVS